jgi:hypothetical protein
MLAIAFNSLPERIRNKIHIEPNSGCWLWAGAWSGGPGNVYGSARGVGNVHRFTYQFFIRKIPKGLDIDHLCKTTFCCNPLHLDPVTARENYRRGVGNHQREKTHCIHGHEFSPENTYLVAGKRQCRECGRRAMREYQRRKQLQ